MPVELEERCDVLVCGLGCGGAVRFCSSGWILIDTRCGLVEFV